VKLTHSSQRMTKLKPPHTGICSRLYWFVSWQLKLNPKSIRQNFVAIIPKEAIAHTELNVNMPMGTSSFNPKLLLRSATEPADVIHSGNTVSAIMVRGANFCIMSSATIHGFFSNCVSRHSKKMMTRRAQRYHGYNLSSTDLFRISK
jgi:hypothetical protein